MSEEKKGIADAENSTTTETMADYARELEASFRTIREGDVISGTVIDVRETGVTLDLGYYAPAVIKTEDLGSHTMFIGEITDMEVLSDFASVTYEYYQNNIKPKPEEVSR